MTLALSRLTRVHSSWVTPRYGRVKQTGGYVSQSPFASRFLSRTNERWLHTSSLQMAKWNLGDSASVWIEEDFKDCVIQEARGGGWYTIELKGSDTTMKCRGTQLRQSATTAPPAATVQTFTASTRGRPTIDVEMGMQPEFPPPPPTIHDLDAAILSMEEVSNPRDRALLEQVAHHASFEKWVVFTDLHVAPATLDTCLEVLTQVHQLAVERSAGVLFLGDFWHHRGTLRVDCLNAVLHHFRTWEVPMVMIPGNHDQVTLGGHSHGLTPFENAYRVGDVAGPLVLSYPTKFRDALFVPHIRDVATMESILQSSVAQESSALFVHADVKGAMMNDLIVSTNGIPTASFPKDKLIYSGHFHKPHTVKSATVKIEYLGSPYETSLSEAQQPKTLAILDSQWRCIEYFSLNIGRRHFKVSSWQDLLQLHLRTSEPLKNYSSDSVKPGDRIVVTIPKEDTKFVQPAVGSHIKSLREAGVMVEVREVKNVPLDAMGSADVGDAIRLEDMSPESTWKAYLEEEERREVISDDNARVLVEAGLEILEEIDATTTTTDPSEQSNAVTDFKLTNVSLEGFGPFREHASYPLWNRGLVLLKGTNNDSGSDSNGSGKSSLAMASLWALTGSLDPRRAQDGKVGDIVNDDSKTARVTLEGSINSVNFSITRTKTASTGSLSFLLDGMDLTTQSVKETQALIEEKMGVNSQILSRTMFHGQHSLNELLESTDGKLKDELSLVVPLGLWQNAATLVRAKSRQAGKAAAELNGMVTLRSEDVEKLFARRDQAEETVKSKQKQLGMLQAKFEAEMLEIEALVGQTGEVDFDELKTQLETVSSEIQGLDDRYKKLLTQRDSDLNPLQRSFKELSNSLNSLIERYSLDEREVFVATLKVDNAKEKMKQLEQKWSVDLSEGRPEVFVTPDTCPTCLQPIEYYSEGEGHSHSDLHRIGEKEIEEVIDALERAEAELETAAKELSECDESRLSREKTKLEMQVDIERASLRWNEELRKIEEGIQSRRREHANLSEKLSIVANKSQLIAKRDAARASINAGKTNVEFANVLLTGLEGEIREGEDRLNRLKTKMEEQNKFGRTMSDLAERFGQRGVQTFVLQNVVEALQVISQTYLDDLSDGAQRLQLSLDAGDRISRTAFVCGSDGEYKERPLSNLSGGQWRRCSLALTFGFAELVARQGKLRPSICILDEPLTHLDRSGRAKVGEVIRRMLRPAEDAGFQGFGGLGMSTVLLILQDLAAEELDEAFDCIDEVVKEKSESYINVDELS